MKTKICYNIRKLQELITKHELRYIDCKKISEEYGSEGKRMYFAAPEVESINFYLGCFTDTMLIFLKDTNSISAYSDNLSSINGNTDLLRINNNKYVSPELLVNGDWLEETKEFRNWLSVYYPDITDDVLSDLSQKFIIYDTIEYPGVPTPEKHDSKLCPGWSYSSNSLVLDEREIESVLNSIEDELLRKKIECILYARIFKKR